MSIGKNSVTNITCRGKTMVIVKLEHGTHVMDIDEWKYVEKKLHLGKMNSVKVNKIA